MNVNKEKTTEPRSRSLILEIEDAKVNISREVSSALRKGLPCYLVKDILENLLAKVREGANAELAAARAQEAAETEPKEKEDPE